MNTATLKNITISAASAAVLAAALTISTMSSANAKSSDFWKGLGIGVATTVVVGAAIKHQQQQQNNYTQWDAHVDWCYDNKRKYRESDNSWKPINKARRTCFSPFYN